MKVNNPIRDRFDRLTEIVNSSENSILNLLSAFVPYLVPIIPAALTLDHVEHTMGFSPLVARASAFVVEVLGMAAVHTAIKFYRWNLRYKIESRRAPFWLALGVYAFYLVIVLTVNVLLEVEAARRTPVVIIAIGLFSLLSVPSGVLVSIRSQFFEMLDERSHARPVSAALVVNNADTDLPVLNGNARPKIEKICEACGKKFLTKFPQKKTCSPACRKRLSRMNGGS